ncbi:hypothetical protein RJD40_20040 [Vibrio scophthalmi]|uniref:hypothetical protein n=1 Tax=Vibrio scophthalmi TaxID=45658 RepID=UPI003AABF621
MAIDKPQAGTTWVSAEGYSFYIEDVWGEDDDDFFLVDIIDTPSRNDFDAAGDQLTGDEWHQMIERFNLKQED